jgi:hypothetical protein
MIGTTRTRVDSLLKYCGNCVHLSLTERQQNEIYQKTGRRLPHHCNYYNEQVKHFGYQPSIVRLGKCRAYRARPL